MLKFQQKLFLSIDFNKNQNRFWIKYGDIKKEKVIYIITDEKIAGKKALLKIPDYITFL